MAEPKLEIIKPSDEGESGITLYDEKDIVVIFLYDEERGPDRGSLISLSKQEAEDVHAWLHRFLSKKEK